ncbi:hypothetical protein Dfri01_66760 [Dyadobacter frigoris]|uniref:DUF6520 family protein n=1 Tax=Dyadobacter frigoris TaxID=2576211 RepID=UPI0024A342B8|nr:DUF6520 family protein [Dyadobacter frigoris]GLU57215.1 hypothetical protein Dfri01_66760 [Dyadobacter frigoris]
MTTKKIIFPVLAAMIAVGAAFATSEKKEEKSKPVLTTYFVVSEDDTSYQVTSTPDPSCLTAGSQVCAITTEATPENGRIDKDDAAASGWKN